MERLSLPVLLLLPLSIAQQQRCREPFSKFPSHTLCSKKYFDYCESANNASQWGDDIIWMHNRYRSQLALGHLADFPAAGNMLQMRWDKELAEVAQALAERCSTVEGVVTHDRPGDRTTLTFRSVGQNIFSERAPLLPERLVVKWHFVVRDWFDQNYRYSSSQVENYEEVKKTQNFTQIAWARSYAVGCGFTTNKDTESENLSSEEDRKSSRSQRSSKELMCILVLVLLCLSVVSSLSVVYSDWWMLAALFPPLATTNLVQAEPVLRLDVAPLTSYGSDVHVKLERLPTIPNAPAQEAPFESLLEQFPPRGVADGTVARSRRRHDDDQRSRLHFPFGASPSLQHISRTNISLLSLARDNNQPKKTPASPEHRYAISAALTSLLF
ncbi:hypothetical protein V5799_015296 [Amblyomma americanum]|uniref:SCP domain-containing protein n=1 Tax=Amblyomma americanum TaxID=6943 RepID=A0AAQ4E0J9_AMBAM